MADPRANIVISAEDRTRAAFAAARANLDGFKASAVAMRGAVVPALGAVTAAAAVAIATIRSVANGIDKLNDLKDATGASIENISALEDIADRTGSSFDAVGASLVKLNQGLKDAKPDNPVAQTLKAIGLSADELRQQDPAEALRQVAVALGKYADDGNKARIVQELFGRSVREVAPFLKDLSEQSRLNAKVTTEQAEAAEKFNQQIFALEKNIKDAARSLVSDMIPALNEFFAKLKEGADFGGFFNRIKRGLDAEVVSDDLKRVTGQIASLQKDIDRQGASPLLAKRMQALQAEADLLTTKALAASEALKATFAAPPAQRDGLRALRELDNATLPKRSAPNLPDPAKANKAAEEALALLRKTSDGRIKAIQDSLAAERDAYAFQDRFLEQIYDQGNVALQQFYDAQDATRKTALEATRAAVAAEIAEREKLLKSPLLQGADKASEREAVRNEIAQARTRLAAAEREFDQAASSSALERQRTTAALRAELQTLQADIQALAGDSSARDLLDIARQVSDARRLLRDSGGDEGLADELGRQLERQRQLNQVRENLGRITRDAQVAEERLLIAADASAASRTEVEQSLGALRRKAIGELAEQVRKAEELAASADPNSPAAQFARELRLELERAERVVDPLRLRLEDFADSVAGNLARSITDAVIDGDWRGAGRRIADDLVRGIIEEDFTRPLQDELRKLLRGGVGGATEGTGVLGNVLGGLFGIGGGNAAPGSDGPRAADNPPPQRDILRQIEAAAVGLEDVAVAATDLTPAIDKAMGAFDSLPTLLGDLFSGIDFGGGGGLLDGLAGLFFHKGGIAGKDGSFTRYHSGGIAGLRPDEVPAILQRGEEVLTRGDPRHRDNGGRSITVNSKATFVIQGGGGIDRATLGQAAARYGRMLSAEINRGTAGDR